MRYIHVDPVADVVIARFGDTRGSLDFFGWPALFDEAVAELEPSSDVVTRRIVGAIA